MRPAFVAAAALVLILPAGAAGQPPAADPDRQAALTLALVHLQRAAATLPPVFRSPELTRAVDWLNSRASSTDPAMISEEYLDALRHAAAVLNGPLTREAVDDVLEELRTKVEHCRALGIGMGGTVLLKVHTRRGPAQVGDLRVMYLLKFYEHVKGASPIRFARLSTPTEEHVPPGRYVVWAEDPATGRTSERVLVRLAGRTEFDVDLLVP
jgi:hypothetical protein